MNLLSHVYRAAVRTAGGVGAPVSKAKVHAAIQQLVDESARAQVPSPAVRGGQDIVEIPVAFRSSPLQGVSRAQNCTVVPMALRDLAVEVFAVVNEQFVQWGLRYRMKYVDDTDDGSVLRLSQCAVLESDGPLRVWGSYLATGPLQAHPHHILLDASVDGAMLPRVLLHELGHVFGAPHPHQLPGWEGLVPEVKQAVCQGKMVYPSACSGSPGDGAGGYSITDLVVFDSLQRHAPDAPGTAHFSGIAVVVDPRFGDRLYQDICETYGPLPMAKVTAATVEGVVRHLLMRHCARGEADAAREGRSSRLRRKDVDLVAIVVHAAVLSMMLDMESPLLGFAATAVPPLLANGPLPKCLHALAVLLRFVGLADAVWRLFQGELWSAAVSLLASLFGSQIGNFLGACLVRFCEYLQPSSREALVIMQAELDIDEWGGGCPWQAWGLAKDLSRRSLMAMRPALRAMSRFCDALSQGVDYKVAGSLLLSALWANDQPKNPQAVLNSVLVDATNELTMAMLQLGASSGSDEESSDEEPQQELPSAAGHPAQPVHGRNNAVRHRSSQAELNA
jgi:hypothetical protein